MSKQPQITDPVTEKANALHRRLRRERIATAVLQGLAANSSPSYDPTAQQAAATAVIWADDLIAALDKEPG